jgi:hypothetical protein
MVQRILLVFACVSGLARAEECTCTIRNAQEARKESDVVFRGTIIALRESAEPSPVPVGDQDPKKFVVFRVRRIWKGDTGPTFEMPAVEAISDCLGFSPSFLKVGNDLLVYAGRVRSYTVPVGGEIVTFVTKIPDNPIYFTSACMRTALAKDTKDLEDLGPGEEPKKPTPPNSK